jgi:hypothetical protein
MGADLTRIEGFPAKEPLRHHEDLVVHCGLAKEAVAPSSPLSRSSQSSPSMLPLRAFYFVRFISLRCMASFVLFSW